MLLILGTYDIANRILYTNFVIFTSASITQRRVIDALASKNTATKIAFKEAKQVIQAIKFKIIGLR